MTDAEIIKALEHCKVSNCLGCPCHTCDENCLDLLTPNALALIKRQKAEIERLQQNLEEAHIDIREHMAEIEKYENIKATMTERKDEGK